MRECQSDYTDKGIIAFGCSLGATHAANLYFRARIFFNGLLALSGIYEPPTDLVLIWMIWFI